MLGRLRRKRPLTWSVVVSAPRGEAGSNWGDTWFATDLVDALTRAGQRASVVFRQGASSPAREEDDVVVVLRGLHRVVPRRGRATWLLWVISHPELVEAEEPAQYDGVFAASAHWSRTGEFGLPVTPLLQATNPRRFRPEAAAPDTGDPLLFVGNTRGEFRPVVRAAIDGGLDVSVYGNGWDAFLPAERITGASIPNANLPRAYAAAGVVLNDHWPDMAAEGFLSNRLFDVAACATRILSDRAVGMDEVFGGHIRTFDDDAGLVAMLGAGPSAFPDRDERLALARTVAREHSFDARARVLIERVAAIRGHSAS